MELEQVVQDEKGAWITISDDGGGRAIFVGGPGQGGGGTGGSTTGNLTPTQRREAAWTFYSEEGATRYGDENFTEWENSLTDEERRAVKNYTTDGYYHINKGLRNKSSMTEAERRNIANIDSALEKSTIPDDVTVFRGFSPERADAIKVGGFYMDRGFMSTAMAKEKTEAFGRGRVQITVPRGSRGAYVGNVGNFKDETEILFPRSSVFRVTGRGPDGTVYMELLS